MRFRLSLIFIMVGALLYVTAFPGTAPHASVYDGQEYYYGPAGVNTTTTVIKTTTKTTTATTDNLEIKDFDDFQDFLEENWLFLIIIMVFVWLIIMSFYKRR